MSAYSLAEMRRGIASLPQVLDQEDLEDLEDAEPAMVLDQGQPIMAVLSWQLYDSLLETLEILNDDQMMADLRRALLEEGGEKPWEEVKKELHR